MAAHGLHLIVRFVITPFLLISIGLEAYGFWALLFAMLGLLGVHRQGIVGSVITYVARYHAEGNPERVSHVVRTGASLALVFALLMGVPLWLLSESIVAWTGIAADLAADAVLTLRLAAGATLVAMVLGGYQGTLEALQEHPRVRFVDAVASVCEAALTVGLLLLGLGLPALAIAYALRLLVPIPVYAAMARRRVPSLRGTPGCIDRTEAMRLLRFGGSIQLLGVLHLAIAAVDRAVLTRAVSLAAAGAYEIARKLINLASALPMQGLAPVAPAAARLHALEADGSALRQLIVGATRVVCMLSAVPIAFLVVFGERFLVAWVGPEQAHVAPALQWLCVGAYVHLATGPITGALRGLARLRHELTYAAVWLASSLVLLPLAVERHGLIGVAAAAACAQAGSSLLLVVLACPGLRIKRGLWLRDVVLPIFVTLTAALGTDALFASFLPTELGWGFGTLVASALVVGVSSLLVAMPVLLSRRERRVVSEFMSARLRRSTRASEAKA